MKPYPHRYHVRVSTGPDENAVAACEGLPDLVTAPPREFDGPGDRWSPETLLLAAAADCFVLTFRAIARASKLPWHRLQCEAEGVLDRVDGVARFTEMHLHARLVLDADADAERAKRLVDKAEKACLITNSLLARRTLALEIAREHR